MGKSVTNVAAFDPFNQVLAADERLRLKDGQLTVEKSDVRSTASGWTKFWTRGQYSQSAILKEMSKLYKAAKNEQKEDQASHLNNTFLENYRTLVGRAITQNVECSKLNSLSRFFKAKSAINIQKAYSQIDQIDTDLVNTKAAEEIKTADAEAKALADSEENEKISLEVAPELEELIKLKTDNKQPISETLTADYKIEYKTPWWNDEYPDANDAEADDLDTPVLWTSDNFIGRPYQLLTPLGMKAKEGNDTDQLEKLLTALNIDTVKKQKEKKINGPLHLELYLLQNKEAILKSDAFKALDFLE